MGAEEGRALVYLDRLHRAAALSIDFERPIIYYLRSAASLFLQATIYLGEDDLEKAFILYVKFTKYAPRPCTRLPRPPPEQWPH